MALALQLVVDWPLQWCYALSALVVLPLAMRGITLISRLQAWTQPLWLFLLVLNAAMVALVAWLVPGFQVAGFWTAVGAALIVSLVSWAASSVIGSNGRVEILKSRR